MNFFTKIANLKKNIFLGWGEGRARVSEFFTKNQNLKKNIFSFYLFFFGGVGGGGLGMWVWGWGGSGGGRWMDSRTGPNQFAPSISSKLGGITMH